MEYTEEFSIKIKKPKWVSSITREFDGYASSGFSSPDDVSYYFAFFLLLYHTFVRVNSCFLCFSFPSESSLF